MKSALPPPCPNFVLTYSIEFTQPPLLHLLLAQPPLNPSVWTSYVHRPLLQMLSPHGPLKHPGRDRSRRHSHTFPAAILALFCKDEFPMKGGPKAEYLKMTPKAESKFSDEDRTSVRIIALALSFSPSLHFIYLASLAPSGCFCMLGALRGQAAVMTEVSISRGPPRNDYCGPCNLARSERGTLTLSLYYPHLSKIKRCHLKEAVRVRPSVCPEIYVLLSYSDSDCLAKSEYVQRCK